MTRPDAAAKGHRPDASAGGVVSGGGLAAALASPVSRDDRRGGEIPTLVQVVVDEVLQQHLVYIRPVLGAGDGEYVIDQGSEGPMSGLDQGDRRRAEAQFSLAEGRAGGGGDDNCRPKAPDQLAGFCRREKEGWVHVSEAVFSAGVRGWGRLPDDGLNGPRDQHPFFADADRNHGLNVEHVLGSVVRPDSKVRVVLKGNADEAGDGILCGLGQGSRVVCGCSRRGRRLGLFRGEAYG